MQRIEKGRTTANIKNSNNGFKLLSGAHKSLNLKGTNKKALKSPKAPKIHNKSNVKICNKITKSFKPNTLACLREQGKTHKCCSITSGKGNMGEN